MKQACVRYGPGLGAGLGDSADGNGVDAVGVPVCVAVVLRATVAWSEPRVHVRTVCGWCDSVKQGMCICLSL